MAGVVHLDFRPVLYIDFYCVSQRGKAIVLLSGYQDATGLALVIETVFDRSSDY